MKLIILFLFIAFISLSGCNTSTSSSTNESKTTDTAALSVAKVEFHVKGMHCTGCENTIKASVNELQGIDSITASFKENTAIVTYDSTKTNAIAIVSAIEDAGYKVDTFMRRR